MLPNLAMGVCVCYLLLYNAYYILNHPQSSANSHSIEEKLCGEGKQTTLNVTAIPTLQSFNSKPYQGRIAATMEGYGVITGIH